MIEDDDDDASEQSREPVARKPDVPGEGRMRAPSAVEKKAEELWSEIERDLSRDLAIETGRSEPDRERDTNGDGDKPARGAPERRDPQSLPEEITKRYYCQTDHAGERHIYADSKGARELFQASETRLRTKTDDPQCVKMMLDTAAHRGWSSITARGSDEFRRETWLEGQARGIEVKGYKPNELDRQELKRREQAHLRNEISPAVEREVDGMARGAASGDRGAPASSERERQAANANYKDGIEGVLVEKGERPYRDNPKADPSPYAVLRDAQGHDHTAWGVGLPGALMQAGAREGDLVRVREVGMERVTKSVIREVDGQPVRVEQGVNRRAWEATVTRVREDIEREGQKIVNGRDAPGVSEREGRIQAVGRKTIHMVDSRDQTLHVGAGRDVAVNEGVLANEARAKEYMAQGRASAATNPALRDAAAMEAYIERKVRAKFGADPVAVDRVMAMARQRIGSAIAQGHDFPKVRVEESRERSVNDLERSRDRSDPGLDRDRGPGEPRAASQREQERDRDRDHERDIERLRERPNDRDRGRSR